MNPSLISTSKFLSLVLRHRPELLGLKLDEHGWADVDKLLEAARRHGRPISRELLLHVVAENDKHRFALSGDRTKIRASQGHSLEVDLTLEPVEPPEVLFHGTVERFLAAIRMEGLKAGSRQYVHLSPDTETATAVGRRRGSPIVLTVESTKMYAEGHEFFLSENGVWLTEHVPPRYLRFPET